MVCLVAAALLGQGGYILKVLPPPTGQNGYEEYARAAEIAQLGGAGIYRGWIEQGASGSRDPQLEPPPGVDPQDHDIEVRRKWNEKFRPCLELITAGNRKPVYDPRETINPETTFPELAEFKILESLEANAARISFAEGASGGGVASLEEGFTFANKLGGKSILVTRLVGIACASIAFSELDGHWPQLCLDDARELKHYFSQRLGPPETLIEALTMEKKMAGVTLGEVLKNPQLVIGNDDSNGISDQMKKLNEFDQQHAISDAIAKSNACYDQLIQALNGPESGWLNVPDFPDATPQSPLSSQLASIVLPSLSTVAKAEMKDRIRYRLAYLNACAVEFRWVNGRLPKRIDEFTTVEERTDPITGAAYRYRQEGRWFRIIREGRDALGSQEVRNPPPPVTADTGGGPY